MIKAEPARVHAGWLGRWYAEPLVPEQARSLLEQAQRIMHRGQRSGHHCITGRLQIMIARYSQFQFRYESEQRISEHRTKGGRNLHQAACLDRRLMDWKSFFRARLSCSAASLSLRAAAV